jgi:hypothetical protein
MTNPSNIVLVFLWGNKPIGDNMKIANIPVPVGALKKQFAA